ncbi:hypothetical protein HPP92_024488 [Vanilla planifolia]|uniref:Uncharacterized protein n=1 Tax=Vanilla planifolia TaxID=51239 RepID=A0A835UD10_VANPL|nr:hypothetical protein HPP92_024760 [Vanilla planifolia]KAG0456700.1 hypothetical protein HPP92_024488 [Vanilla planifolia]
MGSIIGKRRWVVDGKRSGLEGLQHHRDIDHEKLRRLNFDCTIEKGFMSIGRLP